MSITYDKQASIDATQMTATEIHEKLDLGYQDAVAGKTHDAKEALNELKGKLTP